MAQINSFDRWEEAFDTCRILDKPIIAYVVGTRYKLYPSGRAEEIKDKNSQKEQGK